MNELTRKASGTKIERKVDTNEGQRIENKTNREKQERREFNSIVLWFYCCSWDFPLCCTRIVCLLFYLQKTHVLSLFDQKILVLRNHHDHHHHQTLLRMKGKVDSSERQGWRILINALKWLDNNFCNPCWETNEITRSSFLFQLNSRDRSSL